MPWNARQKCRLTLERRKLEGEYSKNDIKWIHPSGDTKIELRVTTNRGNVYRLRVHVPEDFPNSVPQLVVCESPQPMPDWDESHENHTLERRNGLINICHFYYRLWSPKDNRIVDVFKRGRQWLEAYESSFETGRPMDFYLDHADVPGNNLGNRCTSQ
jgi:hypothetical protein